MRKLKNGCCVRASILGGNTTNVLNTKTGAPTVVPQAIRSANVSTVKNGTLTTSGRNAKKNVPACGAHRTIFTKSVLTFKTKTKNMRNVQTAMKHIRHGLKTVWHSKQPLKAQRKYFYLQFLLNKASEARRWYVFSFGAKIVIFEVLITKIEEGIIRDWRNILQLFAIFKGQWEVIEVKL